MPRLPKPPDQRRRRNLGQNQWQELPAEGRKGETPDLPGDDWLEQTLEWWNRLWHSPMATMYAEADFDGLVRLAHLKDEFWRGDRSGARNIESLEDRFGLSPKARRQLQWEIKRGEVVEMPQPQKNRRLRAVESTG